MMAIFRKEIRVTRNLDECNRIRNLLQDHNIQTAVVTNTPANPGRHHGVPFIDGDAVYEYHIFVGRNEEKEALQVLKLL